MELWKKLRKSDAELARGVMDTPLGRDSLSIDAYVSGLTRFMTGCQTPMTIAVQGDWGTGKTNMMLLAERALAPHGHFRLSDPPEAAPREPTSAAGEDRPQPPIYTIRFNTWQYSQFNMQERLVGSLLENIGAHLLLADPGRGATVKRTAFLQALRPIASAAGLSILRAALGAVGLGVLSTVIDDVQSSHDKARDHRAVAADEDTAAVLVDVKHKFAEAVDELVTPDNASEGTPRGRVVVFIDDLDRLEPRKAVELMESLKLFLDVENCVFVIAIDFAIVEQGVVAKYGAGMDRAKARSFFDKIIQVPFQMPTAAYQIDGLLTELIAETGLELAADDRATLLDLIRFSVGSNPRSIKRLVNTYMLLRDIAGIARATAGNEAADLQLFAVLCLQTAYPDAYLDIVANGMEDSELFQRFFTASDMDVTGQWSAEEREAFDRRLESWGIEAGGQRFRQLAARISGVFGGAAGIDVERFAHALGQAVTTSSGAGSAARSSTRGPKAYGAEERRARMLTKFPWAAKQEPLRLPQRFAGRLEENSRVRVGAPVNEVHGWVIELDGKRIGMLMLRQKFFHLALEPRWFAEKTPGYFVNRFREQFAGSDPDLSARIEEGGDGWFQVKQIRHDEVELVDRLAAFWVDVIAEDLSKR